MTPLSEKEFSEKFDNKIHYLCEDCNRAYERPAAFSYRISDGTTLDFCRPCALVLGHQYTMALPPRRFRRGRAAAADMKGQLKIDRKRWPAARRRPRKSPAKKAPKSKVSTDVDLARCVECGTLILKDQPVVEHADGTFTCQNCAAPQEDRQD